jgi:hypothetical protein
VDEVKKTNERALQFLGDPDQPLKVLRELNGVGPATAAALLDNLDDEGNYPCMSDEAMEAILGVKLFSFSVAPRRECCIQNPRSEGPPHWRGFQP